MSTKRAETDDDDEELSSKPIPEVSKKTPTEIPLILVPSQIDTETNPWLTGTTTNSSVLPSSEYSKPIEVQNEDTSSSDIIEKIEQDQTKTVENNVTYGITTSKPSEHLNMPITTKQTQNEMQQTEQHQMNIQEAFADDDVVAEFEKEKVKRSTL